MGEIKKTQLCKCEKCGNEAEMVVTCQLEDAQPPTSDDSQPAKGPAKVKGTATCSHCGNEADMWVDI